MGRKAIAASPLEFKTVDEVKHRKKDLQFETKTETVKKGNKTKNVSTKTVSSESADSISKILNEQQGNIEVAKLKFSDLPTEYNTIQEARTDAIKEAFAAYTQNEFGIGSSYYVDNNHQLHEISIRKDVSGDFIIQETKSNKSHKKLQPGSLIDGQTKLSDLLNVTVAKTKVKGRSFPSKSIRPKSILSESINVRPDARNPTKEVEASTVTQDTASQIAEALSQNAEKRSRELENFIAMAKQMFR